MRTKARAAERDYEKALEATGNFPNEVEPPTQLQRDVLEIIGPKVPKKTFREVGVRTRRNNAKATLGMLKNNCQIRDTIQIFF